MAKKLSPKQQQILDVVAEMGLCLDTHLPARTVKSLVQRDILRYIPKGDELTMFLYAPGCDNNVTRLLQVAMEYHQLKDRKINPHGTFDGGGRWYPSQLEKCPCCDSIRKPSRAYPYSLLTHCRSLGHVAASNNVDEGELRQCAMHRGKWLRDVFTASPMTRAVPGLKKADFDMVFGAVRELCCNGHLATARYIAGQWPDFSLSAYIEESQTTQPKGMMYSIGLTDGEFAGLQFCDSRGYSGDLLKHASVEDTQDGVIIGFYEEYKAWAWRDAIEEDHEAFGVCMGPTLLAHLFNLLEQIV